MALASLLAACGGPTPTPTSSPTPAKTVVKDGPFQLTFELPGSTWKAGDAITGQATLVLTQGDTAALSGSNSILGFEFAEVGGDRHTQVVWTAACGQYTLLASKPMTSDIVKTGAYQGDAPPGDFNREFLTDPLVRLPVGRWDITAIALFSESLDCSGPSHEMNATVRVTVTE